MSGRWLISPPLQPHGHRAHQGRSTTASSASSGRSARRGCCGRSGSTAARWLLRSRLGLDSGYLSRLLRSLEAAGLVTPSAARATSGFALRASLPLAAPRSTSAPTSSHQRERLDAAVRDVERLLICARSAVHQSERAAGYERVRAWLGARPATQGGRSSCACGTPTVWPFSDSPGAAPTRPQ